MTVQQLRHFLAVCNDLNYTKAAERCFLSRQALRQSISALENELKYPLFFMEANKLRLTESGELLMQRAAPVVAAFGELEEYARSGSVRKCLRIGVSYSLVPDYLPRLQNDLKVFSQRNPNLEVHIVHMSNDELPSAVLEDRLDCALMLDMSVSPNGLKRYELSSHPSALLFSANNKLAEHNTVRISELAGQTVCLPGQGDAFSPLFEPAKECEPPVRFRPIDNYFQVYYLVREENAAAVNRYIPQESYSEFVRNIPVPELPPICCSLIVRQDEVSDAIAKLLRYLKRELKKNFSVI